MDSSIFSSVFSLISVFTPLLIFIASCYYLSKQVKTDSVLLFIGSGITFLLGCLYIAIPYLAGRNAWSVSEMSFYYSVLGFSGLVGGVCFAIGFFMLINNMINASKMISGKF